MQYFLFCTRNITKNIHSHSGLKKVCFILRNPAVRTGVTGYSFDVLETHSADGWDNICMLVLGQPLRSGLAVVELQMQCRAMTGAPVVMIDLYAGLAESWWKSVA